MGTDPSVVFPIQHDVLFRRISDDWSDRTQNMKYHLQIRFDQILQLLIFDIAPNLLTLNTPQWNNHYKYIGINRKANMGFPMISNIWRTLAMIKEIIMVDQVVLRYFFEGCI